MLTKAQTEKMTEILNIEGEPPGLADALGLALKMMALQTLLFDRILGEIAGVERCLERLAAKDFI